MQTATPSGQGVSSPHLALPWGHKFIAQFPTITVLVRGEKNLFPEGHKAKALGCFAWPLEPLLTWGSKEPSGVALPSEEWHLPGSGTGSQSKPPRWWGAAQQ